MSDYTTYLRKLLGHEPSELESLVFACFNPEASNREKRFARYNPSRPLFLNIDDDHYVYISNHRNTLRCRLDMATRHLDTSACYHHEHGTIMFGVARPQNEKSLRSRHINYNIYVQAATEKASTESLTVASKYADHISMICDETPWERLCQVCISTHTGGHITSSRQRLFKNLDNGLLYIVPDHHNHDFKHASAKFDLVPVFIGKTVSYPILSLDNEDGLLEIPLSTLKHLQQARFSGNNSRSLKEDQQEEDPENREETPVIKDNIERLIAFLEEEQKAYPFISYNVSNEIPELHIDQRPLTGLSFTENGVQLHTLLSIVNLLVCGRRPLALTYYLETNAEFPQELDGILSSIQKSVKLFNIPIANNCIIPGETDRLHLFFISTDAELSMPRTFQHTGDFICLLGDPNGVLEGSAYAQTMGWNSKYTPPGIMAGTLAAITDVIKECTEKSIISSADLIHRGGLIAALQRAVSPTLGAAIYSERKSPEEVFIFGEPQAAVLVTLKEKHLIDLARITSNYNLTSTTIGRVTDTGKIIINNEMLFTKAQ